VASDKDKSEERAQQTAQMKMRSAINDAYAALQGDAATQSFVAFTFEEAVDSQIERISGTSTRLRPNELDRVTAIQNNLTQAIQVIKQSPPSAFMAPDPTRDVNTPVTPTGSGS
jgi:hypothetical protein